MPEVEEIQVAELTTLRYATEPSQGVGWSVYGNEHWASPVRDWGAVVINDDNGVPRSLVLDRNDDLFYELATTDRVTFRRPSYVDKADVQDAEITTEKWTREETVSPLEQHKRLIDVMNHMYVRPQYDDNRGETGYTATGMRAAQEFGLDVYLDGEKTTAFLSADDVGDNGDASFAGDKVESRRQQYVLRTVASEVQIVGRQHELVAVNTMGSRADRASDEWDYQDELAQNLVVWLSRGLNKMLDLANGNLLNGTAVDIAGPDGSAVSGFTLTTPTDMENVAIATNYTQIVWANVLHGGFTQVGATTAGGWMMQYRRGAGGLPANMVLPAPFNYFDMRLYSVQITDGAMTDLYNSVVNHEGRAYLPMG